MPTYEYVCSQCGYEFERFQSMKEEPVKICPECNAAKVRRLIGAGAGIIFKGSGFYETDYKRKSGSSSSSAESKSTASTTSAAKSNSSNSGSTKSEAGSSKSATGKDAS